MMLGDRLRQHCAATGLSAVERARQAPLCTGSLSARAGGQRARLSAQVVARLVTAFGTMIADRLGQALWPWEAPMPPRRQLCTAAAELPPPTRIGSRRLDAYEQAVPAADREADGGVAERTGGAAWARRRWARTFWARRARAAGDRVERGSAWTRGVISGWAAASARSGAGWRLRHPAGAAGRGARAGGRGRSGRLSYPCVVASARWGAGRAGGRSCGAVAGRSCSCSCAGSWPARRSSRPVGRPRQPRRGNCTVRTWSGWDRR
jgi:hypothetical protein